MTAELQTEKRLDGVALAVLGKRMEAIVRTMQTTLVKTGRSGVLNTAKDCSCCIVSAGNEMVVMAESLPCHVISGPDLQSANMQALHPNLRPGDAFLHNSPYDGNSHAADHVILVPVFSSDGVHRFTTVVKAHQADCGNAIPTTYSVNARDVYEEGALIFPCVKVQEDYTDRDDILRMCRARIRVPDQWWGDYLAMIGAARIGERRLLALGEEVGWDTLESGVTEWLDYSERRMTEVLTKIPSGRATARTKHDPTPSDPDGVELSVTVETHGEDGTIDIDLTDNPDCLPSGLNLTEATSRAAALIGVFNGIDPTVPQNSGSARRVNVRLRENCCVGIPVHPVSCSVATTNLLDRIANAVSRAFAEISEQAGRAETGLSFPISTGVISGHDPRNGGQPFIHQMFTGWTGGAGGARADGWLTNCGVGDGGALQRDSVEINELRFPIWIRSERLVPDSEGAGQFRGAPSAEVEFGPTEGELDVVVGSDGSINPALGARGGKAGAAATQYRRTVEGELRPVDPFSHVVLSPGETLVGTSCGGGGYGRPEHRDPERVAWEVREGWITMERAHSEYRVAVRPDGTLDEQETERLRDGFDGK